jgi:hypothetical protein
MPDGTPSLGLRGHRREQLVTSEYEGHRFDLRFFRPFRADLSIRKSSSFFPPLIAATSHLGFAPRPAQVSPDGPRYFGGTFFPLKAHPSLTINPLQLALRNLHCAPGVLAAGAKTRKHVD